MYKKMLLLLLKIWIFIQNIDKIYYIMYNNKKVLEEKNLFAKKKLSVGTSKFLL